MAANRPGTTGPHPLQPRSRWTPLPPPAVSFLWGLASGPCLTQVPGLGETSHFLCNDPASGLDSEPRALGRHSPSHGWDREGPCLSFPACELSLITCAEQGLGSVITACLSVKPHGVLAYDPRRGGSHGILPLGLTPSEGKVSPWASACRRSAGADGQPEQTEGSMWPQSLSLPLNASGVLGHRAFHPMWHNNTPTPSAPVLETSLPSQASLSSLTSGPDRVTTKS